MQKEERQEAAEHGVIQQAVLDGVFQDGFLPILRTTPGT